jgi:hypothetical protein
MKPGWTIKTLNPFMGNVSCQSTTRDLKWRQSFRSDVADPAANVPVRFFTSVYGRTPAANRQRTPCLA